MGLGRGGRSGAGGLARRLRDRDLLGLPAAQHGPTWSGSSRPGSPRKSSSSADPAAAWRAELAAVEQHPVERARSRSSASNGELVVGPASVALARLPAASSASSAAPGRRRRSAARPSTWSRSASSSAACSSRIGTDGRNTDAVSPRRRARTNRPTAWAKNSGVDDAGRVDADGQPRDVDALGHHPHRDHPALVGRRRTPRSSLLAAGSSDSTTAGALAGDARAAARRTPGRPSWSLAMTRPPASGTPRRTSVSRRSAAVEHRRDPLARRVQRGPPGLRGQVLGQRLAEGRGDLVAGPGAPAHLARVGQEDHRPDDAVRAARRP